MSRRLSCVFFLILSSAALFAFGRREEAELEPVNGEFVFCVTAPDVSGLPDSRKVTGDTVTRTLAASLQNLDFRFRGGEEYSYYRNYAWAKSRAEAARALEAKQGERDLLLYKGDPPWKYRKNLKALDKTIAELREKLAEIETLAPAVEEKPVLKLTEENINGSYPLPPNPGAEQRFCTEQKADAFLTGSLSEYHGRIYLNIKMYTLFTRSYSFEDSVLFSSADLNEAMLEITGRLAAAVSDTLPSGIIVHTSPPDAMVLVDNSYVAPGDTHTHSRGEAVLEVRADAYMPVSFPLEINSGELAELFVDLSPFGLAAFDVAVRGDPSSRVYQGSLYVGEAPLTLQLPRTQLSYISVETEEGKTGSVIHRSEEKAGAAIVNTKMPVSAEEKLVDRARHGFYGAYGVFWVILPISLVTAGIATTYIEANNYVGASGMYSSDYDTRKKIYDNAVFSRNVQIAAYGVMGAALGVTFFQIFRYLIVSRGDATPIVKEEKQP